MILILSKPNDFSTNMVIDWLNNLHHPYQRINTDDTYKLPWFIDLNNRTIYIDKKEVQIDDINVVWYRKFGIQWGKYFESIQIKSSIVQSLNNEYRVFIETLFYLLKDKKWLTYPIKGRLNKCEVLLMAQLAGFDIPRTYITNSKDHLKDLSKKENLITKSIYDLTAINDNKKRYSMFTKEISKDALSELPDFFFPSQLQQKVEKDFELRVFYLNKKVYAMAMFSQLDKKTAIDSRVANWEYPNRWVPYCLEKRDIKKIVKLMQSLNLNCGSIDFIKSADGKLYFLEINPNGEFGMVDIPCNYNLHQKVALELIEMDKI